MAKRRLTARKMREIHALADASYEALIVVAKASKARHARRLELKAKAKSVRA